MIEIICRIKEFSGGLWNNSKELINNMIGAHSQMANEKLVSSMEDKLWAAANKLRGSIDASKYKNIVLGIVFLKYISDRLAKIQRTYNRR